MTTKIITKKVHDKLDMFVTNQQFNQISQMSQEEVIPQNKKKLKRNDGLIERVDVSQKMYIAEDNRQLLND